LNAQERLRELRVPAGPPVLLFAGKFIAEKDCVLLLSAFIQAQVSGHLILVGNGGFEAQLRARAAGQANIHFLPFQNQQAMPMVYRLGDAYVLPSRSETWGLALNEAMASGRPVIASSRVGGARDLVNDRVNGWLFESGNCGQLVAVIREVLGCDRQVLRAMGKVALGDSARWSIGAAADGISRAVVDFTRRSGGLVVEPS
jgi:glycosyltransferase involved in cell wall biosynthesis